MEYFKNKKIWLTGGSGFLGRSVMDQLLSIGVKSEDIFIPRSNEYDLVDYETLTRMSIEHFVPEIIIHLAAEVGGILANKENPGRFFYSNMTMGLNLIEFARQFGIDKFTFVGTVCSYPKFTPVPFKESDLWNGYPEETNAPYGIAKKALYVMLQAYYEQYGLKSNVVIPTNLYGPYDNFDLKTSHVIPALINKIQDAKERNLSSIECWGDGSASREFLYVQDCANAVIKSCANIHDPEPVNIGTGVETSIGDLIDILCELMDFKGYLIWNNKLNGQPRRCLDVSKAKERLNWNSTTELTQGLQQTIDWYCNDKHSPIRSR